VALAPLTTIGVGGPARFYTSVTSAAEVRSAISAARDLALPWMVLGGGSNVLVGDEGYDGLVIHLDLRGMQVDERGHELEVTAAAGEPWDHFVAGVVERGWAGLETLSGIPGRVGATPIQNVGAYGQEVAETIVMVSALDTVEDRLVDFAAEECRFSYRDSWFKSGAPGRYVVLEVTFRLRVGGAPTVRYAELARRLEGREASLAEVRETVIAVRRGKSMVLDPSDPNSRSCGSFFVNPVVSGAQYLAVEEAAARLGVGEPPRYAAGSGTVKLSAAWLIERAGFPRGYVRGRAGLSANHALAVINRGGATAAEILALVREIQDGVREKFAVGLVPEPVFVGM
jgi:UDP-N-acetylmuramate dehydrogenase